MERNFAPIKQRILQIIDFKGDRKAKIFGQISASKSNFSGKGLLSEVGGEVLFKILNMYPDVSAEWLLTGKGEMIKKKAYEIRDPNPEIICETELSYKRPSINNEMYKDLLNRLERQSEEIGKLKQENDFLKRKLRQQEICEKEG